MHRVCYTLRGGKTSPQGNMQPIFAHFPVHQPISQLWCKVNALYVHPSIQKSCAFMYVMNTVRGEKTQASATAPCHTLEWISILPISHFAYSGLRANRSNKTVCSICQTIHSWTASCLMFSVLDKPFFFSIIYFSQQNHFSPNRFRAGLLAGASLRRLASCK